VTPITELIQQRFSCRSYLDKSIDPVIQTRLQDFIASLQVGPFGTTMRFILVAACEQDNQSLKGLGTYGFIRGARGFLLGSVQKAEKDLEDFGYRMEQIILFVTRFMLGTCWLGGTFTRSSFARLIHLADNETMPAVVSIGYIADLAQARQALLRQRLKADRRLPWNQIFFNQQFGTPLERADAGAYTIPLDMLRLAPSASNKQPWRIIKNRHDWHFYLRRTRGYLDNFPSRLLQIADLQRVDLGIAMCHFELTAREIGLTGEWFVKEPDVHKLDNNVEYIASWAA
jgi:nitroreductase